MTMYTGLHENLYTNFIEYNVNAHAVSHLRTISILLVTAARLQARQVVADVEPPDRHHRAHDGSPGQPLHRPRDYHFHLRGHGNASVRRRLPKTVPCPSQVVFVLFYTPYYQILKEVKLCMTQRCPPAGGTSTTFCTAS